MQRDAPKFGVNPNIYFSLISKSHHISVLPILKKMSDTKELRLALNQIKTSCPFYWGRIDSKTAYAILEDKPNGSYLMKDPIEECSTPKKCLVEFVCKDKIQIHIAHIEIIGPLLATLRHKDRTCFEEFKQPVLCNKPFSLLELAKNGIINSGIRGEDISKLEIPKELHTFIKQYWFEFQINVLEMWIN